jgi:hypothetical protein
MGWSVGCPSFSIRCCQRRFIARTPSMMASEDPRVVHPMASLDALNRSATIRTHRREISWEPRYSSASMMLVLDVSMMRRSASSSSPVVQNVAKFILGLISKSFASSETRRYATELGRDFSGRLNLGHLNAPTIHDNTNVSHMTE